MDAQPIQALKTYVASEFGQEVEHINVLLESLGSSGLADATVKNNELLDVWALEDSAKQLERYCDKISQSAVADRFLKQQVAFIVRVRAVLLSLSELSKWNMSAKGEARVVAAPAVKWCKQLRQDTWRVRTLTDGVKQTGRLVLMS